MYFKNSIIFFLIFLFSSCNSKSERNIEIKERDKSFDELFSILKENFIDRDSIDWNSFEKAVLLKNKISKDSAIIEALTLLGNRHTSYMKANGIRLRGKFKKRNIANDEICEVSSAKSDLFKNLKNVAYLKIDRIDNQSSISEKEYILKSLSTILDQVDSEYWIIDLRDNTGGAIWPMLVSLLPFYEEGKIGSNVFKQNNFRTPWIKKDGSIYLGDQNQSKLYLDDKIYFTVHPKRVFVLINQKTMSAGEATAISLKSLQNVEFLGSKTGGFTTNNADITLSNFDKLRLTINYMGDFKNRIYKNGVLPDSKFCSDKDLFNYIKHQVNKN